MNLIEQLGGYERAKAFLNAASYTMDELIMMQRSGLRPQHVEKALLDYRRQHNIYEDGDLVVHDAHIGDEIYEFISLLEDIGMATVKSKHMTGGCSLRGLRHATPEEIKAGKRLEVG